MPPIAVPAAPPSPRPASPAWSWSTKAGASSELLAKLLDAYAAEPGAVTVDVFLCGIGEQERLLRDGRADVALLHRPFDSTAGFDTEELCTEGQVVVLPAGHQLSGRARLRMADVAALPGLPMPRWPAPDGTYPDGPGPQVRENAQLFQLIALGRASAVLPESLPYPSARRPRRRAAAGRADSDHGDRLAAAQPVPGPRRAGAGRDPPLIRGSAAAPARLYVRAGSLHGARRFYSFSIGAYRSTRCLIP